MSKGGKAFICMTSSFKDKEGNLKSRFVPSYNGEAITDPRSQAFYLVTEYGIANLEFRRGSGNPYKRIEHGKSPFCDFS